MSITSEQFALLATREDFKRLATKVDLDKKINEVLAAIENLTNSIVKFQAELASKRAAHIYE